MSQDYTYTAPNGDRYSIGFISSGMGRTDYSIVKLGTQSGTGWGWEPRIIIDTETKQIMRHPENLPLELCQSALDHYRKCCHEEFLEW